MSTFGSVLATVNTGITTGRVAWSPDGRWIAGAYMEVTFGPLQPQPIVLADTGTGEVKWRSAERAACRHLAFSPDGARLAAAVVKEAAILLLDARDGSQVWRRPQAAPWRLRFSPDGRFLAVIDDEAVRLLNAATGQEIVNLGAHGNVGADAPFTRDSNWYVAAVAAKFRLVSTRGEPDRWSVDGGIFRAAFTDDESRLVAVTRDTVITVEVSSGDVLSRVPLEQPIDIPLVNDSSMELSPGLNRYARPGLRNFALWSLADGRRVGTPPSVLMSLDPRVAIGPDGRLLAFTPDQDGGLSLLDPVTGEITYRDPAGATDLAFDPMGGRLAAAFTGGIRVLDVGAQLSQRTFGDKITGLAVNGEGIPLAVAAAKDQTLVVFRADTADTLLNYTNSRSLNALELSPDGESYATGAVDGYVELRRIPSGRASGLRPGRSVNALVYDPTRPDRVLTGSEDKYVRLLALTASGLSKEWELSPAGAVRLVAAAPGGQWYAAATADRFVVVLSAAGAEVCRFEHQERIAALSFGTYLASGGEDGRALLVDPVTRTLVGEPIDHPHLLTAVAASPDGTFLVTADDAGTVRYFDTASGREPTPVREVTYPERVRTLLFHPVDRRLAIVAADAPVLRIVDPVSGAESVRLPHPALIGAAVFAHDGGLLATACDDDTVRVFPGRWQ
jgi:WD40 repeat protein